MIVGLGLGACGPVVDPPVDDGAQSTSETGTSAPGSSGPSPGDASATSDGSGTGPSPSTSEGSSGDSADGSSSGGDGLLVPPDSVITTIDCLPGGVEMLFIEASLVGPYVDCLPPAEIEGYVYFRFDGWDGMPGTFAVGPDGPAMAMIGTDEDVTGTLSVEVWAPYHPSFATIDFTSPSAHLQGVLDLQTCTPINDAPCQER